MTSSPGSDDRTADPSTHEGAGGHHDSGYEPSERVQLDEADLALILAFRAWAAFGPGEQSVSNRGSRTDNAPRAPWQRLRSSWSRTIRTACEVGTEASRFPDSDAALERLRRMHEASIRVDLDRVHPSWCVRALKEESPTVQRVVAACAPEHLRSAILTGLSLSAHDLTAERSAAPLVRSWALALWTERLVGGDSARTDDPLPIVVLSRLSPRSGYLICRLAGQIKSAIGGQRLAQGQAIAGRLERIGELAESLKAADPQFLEQVSRDLRSKSLASVPDRHLAARLGVQSLARLLADCEPFRLRWALQHWPYPIAKLVRSLIPSQAQRSLAVLQGEHLILTTAWNRLNREGKIVRRVARSCGECGIRDCNS
jgi:hypothetical protein